jgi:hypothetical protein
MLIPAYLHPYSNVVCLIYLHSLNFKLQVSNVDDGMYLLQLKHMLSMQALKYAKSTATPHDAI